jgi:hypothetical protein
MPVASDNGSSLCRSGGSDFPTQVQQLRTGHEHPLHHRIAGERCYRSCVELGPVGTHCIAVTMQSIGKPGPFSR